MKKNYISPEIFFEFIDNETILQTLSKEKVNKPTPEDPFVDVPTIEDPNPDPKDEDLGAKGNGGFFFWDEF